MSIEQDEARRRTAMRLEFEKVARMFSGMASADAPEAFRGKVGVRGFLEMPDGAFVSCKAMDAEKTALAMQVVGSDIKRALHGLAPLFGKGVLLAMCAEILEEDYNPSGPQTIWNTDDEDDQTLN